MFKNFKLFVNKNRMTGGFTAMTDAVVEERSSLIVRRQSLPTIELAVRKIDHGLSVEEMIVGYEGNSSDLTSANYPDCHAGKTGIEEASLLLVQAVPGDGSEDTDEVLRIIDEVGFILLGELPDVAVLKDPADCDELWAAGVKYVTALGPNSRWQGPDSGDVYVVCLRLDPDNRSFSDYWFGHRWYGYDWFVVRRK